MQHIDHLAPAASRLLAELMPVSVVVAGPEAQTFASALELAGAAAVTLERAAASDLFDLAVLLAEVGSLDRPQTRQTIAALSALSERLLFVPAGSSGDTQAEAEGPALAALTAWFEPLAELGYQPVVDFDAQFVARGAFLVDRAATAAEGDLAQFADRVAGGAASEPAAPPRATANGEEEQRRAAEASAQAAEIASLRRQLASHESAEASLRHALAAAEAQNAGWDGLRTWVGRHVLSEAKGLAALRAARAALGVARRRRLFGGSRPTREERSLLQEAALLRACALFDPAWYIASSPELARSGADPLLHFLLVGGPAGRDPGPWFESAAYVQANPRAAEERIPLLHAIRMGAATPPPAIELGES
jgi:hypothetical protein